MYRRTAAGWRALGLQPLVYGRVAVLRTGALIGFSPSQSYVTTDDGRSWQGHVLGLPLPAGGSDSVLRMAAVRESKRSDSVLASVIAVDRVTGEVQDGKLLRLDAEGAGEQPAQPGYVTRLVQKRDGTLFASTEDVFGSAHLRSEDDGASWTQVAPGRALDFNSVDRYLAMTNEGSFELVAASTAEAQAITLEGLTSAPYDIAQVRFAADDRLVIRTTDQGLFESTEPVR